ncbi:MULTISPECIES: UDP-N-acetylglucosamine 1-carboxyvinyltransferase [Butyricimonas]|uniref:UDP-N-acetylglucosamine 1-carboxyvinyltransferase n=1 Tax=Butyricimonas hominis TaxID=2763032 RepID=A0ABR7D3C2_9BACT|nr:MULTISPECIES: UDP-N-acetylglucosamine 1-carboxyvinyltransferase [Butyricimonas]MBC5622257.1 UDP-N-acetylglucosamine 1-carboxyvinyltransferase [Butyricimonas hominis]MCB6972759.1 UDP-N-acetylglucosamine 1-carboxyvinyltransferase [Butyricimonas synergistica]MCG4519767.1 UDP-N-acetylglucosamine 1-carboxyvinyltransferase [Butyricimonas sp. DFI.6.44]
MSKFEVIGGKRLKGELVPQGAKNEALQVICACLLTKEEVVISNIPEILDVIKLIELLKGIGVQVERLQKGEYSFKACNVDLKYLETEDFYHKASSLRGSIMILGPLLALHGFGLVPKPGGDKIGRRRLDTHFLGFEKLGATFEYDGVSGCFKASAQKLKGAYMLLDEASVTGTANIVMAAVLAEGVTTIYNAACEPYVQQLCKMLNAMGARISGIASNLLTIEGVESLHGCRHRCLPDMIEIGSYIGLAALTRSEITIKGCAIPQLGIIPNAFRKLGIRIEERDDDLYIPRQEHYMIEDFIDGSILTVADAPWPGLTPDLLSVFLVVATQARGSVLIHQKMFESRLFFVDKLIDMGAKIILCDPHRATVIGQNHESQLRPTKMTSPDIRAGIALLIAALSAPGKSVIDNIDQIDRGYENIDEKLNAIGAEIKRMV